MNILWRCLLGLTPSLRHDYFVTSILLSSSPAFYFILFFYPRLDENDISTPIRLFSPFFFGLVLPTLQLPSTSRHDALSLQSLVKFFSTHAGVL
ncbi:hypothetical protein BDV11DRAFT_80447 [Aspergillus similis]